LPLNPHPWFFNMAELREYQQELSRKIIEAIDAGGRPIAAAHTGSGKSHVIGDVVLRFLLRGLNATVLCHRREIFNHLQRILVAHTGIQPSLCDADNKPNWEHPLILGMVPSLSRRLASTPTDRGGLVLLDEAHHAVAASWIKTIEHLAPAHLAGVTATPVSASKVPLSAIFSGQPILGPTSAWLTEQGHLAPARVMVADNVIETGDARTRNGDWRTDDLEAPAIQLAGDAVPTWRKHAEGRQTIVACVSVKHSQLIATLYSMDGIPAAHVDGSMSIKERDGIIADFSAGKTTVLTFVGIVEEGIDLPEAAVCQFLRPTKSIRLRRQIEGRVRRPHHGKADCLILDHTSGWADLPLPWEEVTWDLKQPSELGARRTGNFVAQRQPNGEVTMVPAEFREITGPNGQLVPPPAPKKAAKHCLVRSRLDSGHRDDQDHLLRNVSTNHRYKFSSLAGMAADPCTTLRHFALIGQALGYKPAWAHHQFRRAVVLRTPDRQRAEIQRVLDQAMKGWASTTEQPEPRRTRIKGLGRPEPSPLPKTGHPLHADGWVWPDGKVGIPVIGFGPQGESPLPPWEHPAARAKLEPLLAEAFPDGYLLAGLWGNLPIPQLEPVLEFGALV
jgi:superfamily II DNA or RNA helicase